MVGISDVELKTWANIAQIIIAIFTVIGVIVSLYLTRRTLAEASVDRHYRQRPHLAFEPGGYRYPIKFVKAGPRIPGVNGNYVEKVFPRLSPDAESVRLADTTTKDGKYQPIFVGKLKNYGSGPAIDTYVSWIPKKIWIGDESFIIDEKKRGEPVYSEGLNKMPTVPSHILPNELSQLTRIPTFIEKDIEKKISRVDGVIKTTSTDVFNNEHVAYQVFHMFTGYTDKKPYLHITFSDIVSSENDGDFSDEG